MLLHEAIIEVVLEDLREVDIEVMALLEVERAAMAADFIKTTEVEEVEAEHLLKIKIISLKIISPLLLDHYCVKSVENLIIQPWTVGIDWTHLFKHLHFLLLLCLDLIPGLMLHHHHP